MPTRSAARTLLLALAAVVATWVTSTSAQAATAPSLDGASFRRAPVTGGPSALTLRSSDSERAVSGAVVAFAGEGAYGTSACRPRNSAGRTSGRAFRPGARVKLEVPHIFRGADPRQMLVRLDAQGCSGGGGVLLAPFTVTPNQPGQPPNPLVPGRSIAIPGNAAGVLSAPGQQTLTPEDAALVSELPIVGELAPGDDGGDGGTTLPGTGVTIPGPPQQPLSPAEVAPGLPLLTARAAARPCPGQDTPVTPATARVAARATLCLINALRAAHGLKPLRPDRRMARAARAHSRAMVAQRFFAHVDPRGRDVAGRLRAARWLPRPPDWDTGENLAFGQGAMSTPVVTVTGWYQSTAHRENMLDRRFDRSGMGVTAGDPVGDAGSGPSATYTHVLGVVR